MHLDHAGTFAGTGYLLGYSGFDDVRPVIKQHRVALGVFLALLFQPLADCREDSQVVRCHLHIGFGQDDAGLGELLSPEPLGVQPGYNVVGKGVDADRGEAGV